MHLNVLSIVLAQATNPSPGQQQSSPFGLLIPMVLMMVILYFLMIRPQQQRAKQQARMLANLKSGDKVVTSGGIIGVVITVKDKTVSLRSADAKMEVTKSSVTDILERSETSAS